MKYYTFKVHFDDDVVIVCAFSFTHALIVTSSDRIKAGKNTFVEKVECSNGQTIYEPVLSYTSLKDES